MKGYSKRIAFLIPTLQGGGMERVMSEIIKYISINHPVTECHLALYGKIREMFYDVPNNVTIHQPIFFFEDNKRHWMWCKCMGLTKRTYTDACVSRARGLYKKEDRFIEYLQFYEELLR